MFREVVKVCKCSQSQSDQAEDPKDAKCNELVGATHTIGLAVDHDHDKFVPPHLYVAERYKQQVIDCKTNRYANHDGYVADSQESLIDPSGFRTGQQEGCQKYMYYIQWRGQTYE